MIPDVLFWMLYTKLEFPPDCYFGSTSILRCMAGMLPSDKKDPP